MAGVIKGLPLRPCVTLVGGVLTLAGLNLWPEGVWRLGFVMAGVVMFGASLLWSLSAYRHAPRGNATPWLYTALAPILFVLSIVLYLGASTDFQGLLDWSTLFSGGWAVALTLGVFLFVPVELSQLRRHPLESQLPGRSAAAAQAGLSLGLLLVLVATLVFVSGRLNWQWDLSYFKTTAPGEATAQAVQKLEQTVEAAAFFPESNPVGRRVMDYLRQIPSPESDGKPLLVVTRHDADLEPVTAGTFKVRGNGRLVLRRGEVMKTVQIGTTLREARAALRKLDGSFHKALLEVSQERRTIYLTVGHGERNERSTDSRERNRRSTRFQTLVRARNFSTKPLGFAEGLGSAIPEDAALVGILGPREPFRPSEIASLRAYLKRGGRLLLFLEPGTGGGDGGLAPLLSDYNIEFQSTLQANDRIFGRRTYTVADHSLLVTNRFGRHPAVAPLARAAAQNPLLFLGSGTLSKGPPRPGIVVADLVRAMPGTWSDHNGDFRFDAPGEVRGTPLLAVAVSLTEGRNTGADPKPRPGQQVPIMAALADVDVASNLLLRHRPNQAFMVSLLDWLVGMEKPAPLPRSEADIRLIHAKQDELVWFYLPVFGAPALVLLVGFIFSVRRRGGGKEERNA